MLHAAVVVPDVLHDDDNPQQQWASSAVKDRLVEMACSEDYTDFLRQFSEANQASAVHTMVEASETSLPQPGDDQLAVAGCEEDDVPQEPDRKRQKRAAVQELMLCLLCRSGNMMVMPFLLVCLTLMAFKTGMSDDCWSMFTYFGMMYNRAWIYDFCARVSTRLDFKIAAWSTVLCVCCVSELGPVRVSHSYSDTRAPVHNILLYSQPGREQVLAVRALRRGTRAHGTNAQSWWRLRAQPARR